MSIRDKNRPPFLQEIEETFKSKMNMQIDHLIKNFCAHLQLKEVPQKDSNGFYEIQIGISPPIFVKDLTPGLFFRGYLSPIAKEKTYEALFIYLMKGNLMGQGTGRATLAIDLSEKFFILTQTLSYEADEKVFYETVENFINYVDFWRDEISEILKKEKIL